LGGGVLEDEKKRGNMESHERIGMKEGYWGEGEHIGRAN